MDMEQHTGSKSGKEYVKAVYCHPAFLLICRVHHVKCQGGGTQAGIKIARNNINNLRYADDHHCGRNQRGAKKPLMKVKEESEKAGIKLSIQK